MILSDNAKRTAAATAIAVAIAAPAEGIRRVWYFDPVGIPTVCMGHTGPDVDKSKVYSLAECDALMTADMKNAVAIVERCAPGLPPQVLGSFADAVFNSGPKIACDLKNSTAARYLVCYYSVQLNVGRTRPIARTYLQPIYLLCNAKFQHFLKRHLKGTSFNCQFHKQSPFYVVLSK